MGTLLVTLQFGLLLLLAWMASPRVADGPISAIAIVLALASIALVVWTFRHNRPGNFNIRPTPRQGGQLITSGPYQYVRHPMYSAVLLFCGGFVFCPLTWWKVVLWLVLCGVVTEKSRMEEKFLQQRFAAYASYLKRTGRFFPKLNR